jgi:hypothetical protein
MNQNATDGSGAKRRDQALLEIDLFPVVVRRSLAFAQEVPQIQIMNEMDCKFAEHRCSSRCTKGKSI